MILLKLIRKLAAPALTLAVVTYVLKAPSGIYFLPFEEADFSDVYVNAEKAAASLIPDKVQSFIEAAAGFFKGFFV